MTYSTTTMMLGAVTTGPIYTTEPITKVVTVTDAMCCPRCVSYRPISPHTPFSRITSHLTLESQLYTGTIIPHSTGTVLSADYFCTRFLNATSTLYNVITWRLFQSIDDSNSTSKTSSASSLFFVKESISYDTVLTYKPIWVRYSNTEATLRPMRTGDGNQDWQVIRSRMTAISTFRTPFTDWGDSNRVKKRLILGLSISLDIVALGALEWAVWYLRYRRRRTWRHQEEARRGKEEKEDGMVNGGEKPELPGSVPELTMFPLKEKPELEARTNVVHTELDEQSGRRETADSELDGRGRERLAAELDASMQKRSTGS